MKRGEVWWISFEQAVGGEIQKKRPAVIVSNNISNKYLNRVQVIPLTSKTGNLYPSEAFVFLEKKKHKAMADQIATVSKMRLNEKFGIITKSDMDKINNAIKIQLSV